MCDGRDFELLCDGGTSSLRTLQMLSQISVIHGEVGTWGRHTWLRISSSLSDSSSANESPSSLRARFLEERNGIIVEDSAINSRKGRDLEDGAQPGADRYCSLSFNEGFTRTQQKQQTRNSLREGRDYYYLCDELDTGYGPLLLRMYDRMMK